MSNAFKEQLKKLKANSEKFSNSLKLGSKKPTMEEQRQKPSSPAPEFFKEFPRTRNSMSQNPSSAPAFARKVPTESELRRQQFIKWAADPRKADEFINFAERSKPAPLASTPAPLGAPLASTPASPPVESYKYNNPFGGGKRKTRRTRRAKKSRRTRR